MSAFDPREYPDPLYVGEDTRGARRQRRVDNGRKMKVVGRSVLLLSALALGQQRRRVSRRKRGVK